MTRPHRSHSLMLPSSRYHIFRIPTLSHLIAIGRPILALAAIWPNPRFRVGVQWQSAGVTPGLKQSQD